MFPSLGVRGRQDLLGYDLLISTFLDLPANRKGSVTLFLNFVVSLVRLAEGIVLRVPTWKPSPVRKIAPYILVVSIRTNERGAFLTLGNSVYPGTSARAFTVPSTYCLRKKHMGLVVEVNANSRIHGTFWLNSRSLFQPEGFASERLVFMRWTSRRVSTHSLRSP